MIPQVFYTIEKYRTDENADKIETENHVMSANWFYNIHSSKRVGVIDSKTFEVMKDLVVYYEDGKLYYHKENHIVTNRFSDSATLGQFLLYVKG